MSKPSISSPEIGSDDEYEYEYEDNETESFLIDIDLSALEPSKTFKVGSQRALKPPGTGTEQGVQASNQKEATPATTEDLDDGIEAPPEQAKPSPEHLQNDEEIDVRQAQILDLHTDNPLVAYKGSVYSCSWSDVVGTNMFFTSPGQSGSHDPIWSTDDYDLIGTSRIKLIGNRAKINKKPGTRKRAREVDEDVEVPEADGENPDGRSFGNFTHTNPVTNMQIRQQASFLEKLMHVKRNRGETDLVRTFVDDSLRAAPSEKREEIDQLNRRVVTGDKDALKKLQQIYSQAEDIISMQQPEARTEPDDMRSAHR